MVSESFVLSASKGFGVSKGIGHQNVSGIKMYRHE
jgi:hypothetical protein